MEDLIAELKRRKAHGLLRAESEFSRGDFSPLDPAEIDLAETHLGFALPPLLRRIYGEIANGGFGYGYGFLGLLGGMLNEDGRDAVAQYLWYRRADPDDPLWRWPEALLPLGHLGCAMFHCVRCDHPDAPVVWFEPNPHEDGEPWDNAFIPFAPSLADYLTAWLEGKDLFAEFMDEA
ncbi:SMI1/KNR4 family protein [Luteimonas gilva]|uniref:SMI1/KNR4 family protein n=1 Tax=Luteimonas gilva TaxID=2572684 RepID=A0A4V5ZPI9_9GAMM|nr:SMI1/KNR4 family protein [Luteimonas gilva]TKR29253.1 SMI1/KNR4 family protein [Luteimonas gilva]